MTELYELFDGLYNFLLRNHRYSKKDWQKKEKLAIPKCYILQANSKIAVNTKMAIFEGSNAIIKIAMILKYHNN